MIILSCKNLSKSYGIDNILHNISFNIKDGEKVASIAKVRLQEDEDDIEEVKPEETLEEITEEPEIEE